MSATYISSGYAAPLFPRAGVMMHPTLGACEYTVTEISDDPEQQVADTVSLMQSYIRQDVASPAVQQDVARAFKSSDPIQDTWDYLHRDGDRGMQFVRDEVNYAPWSDYEFAQPGRWRPLVELLARPSALAQSSNPQGDCDDFVSYGAAHLLSRGVPCSFVTVAADRHEPNIYSHIYLAAYPVDGPYEGKRIPLDLSHGAYPGWEVQQVYRKREWPMMSHGSESLMMIAAALGLAAGAFYLAATRGGGLN